MVVSNMPAPAHARIKGQARLPSCQARAVSESYPSHIALRKQTTVSTSAAAAAAREKEEGRGARKRTAGDAGRVGRGGARNGKERRGLGRGGGIPWRCGCLLTCPPWLPGRGARARSCGGGLGLTGDGGEGVAVLDRVDGAQPQRGAGLDQLRARQRAQPPAGDAAQVRVQQRRVRVPQPHPPAVPVEPAPAPPPVRRSRRPPPPPPRRADSVRVSVS